MIDKRALFMVILLLFCLWFILFAAACRDDIVFSRPGAPREPRGEKKEMKPQAVDLIPFEEYKDDAFSA